LVAVQRSLRSYLPDDIMIVDSQDREVLYRALGVQRLLNLQDAIQLLRSEVKRAGSQRAFARKAGVNVSVVSKTLRGMVLPSEKIIRALKLQVVYLSK
jgi:DNA-binding phage protein